MYGGPFLNKNICHFPQKIFLRNQVKDFDLDKTHYIYCDDNDIINVKGKFNLEMKVPGVKRVYCG